MSTKNSNTKDSEKAKGTAKAKSKKLTPEMLEETIKQQIEENQRKMEIIRNRNKFLKTKEDLQSIQKELNKDPEDIESNAISLIFKDKHNYQNSEILSITNNFINNEFINFINDKIENKVLELEKQIIE